MKKHNNYIFIENDINSVIGDCSDGYIKGIDQDEDKRIKLPHKNYILLGIVAECINAPYAEEFSKEIVEYLQSGEDGYGGYCNYMADAWVYHLETAIESMKTLIDKLDLKPTDYILRDDK
jgi:hypothetical protein